MTSASRTDAQQIAAMQSLHQEVSVSLLRGAAFWEAAFDRLFESYGITITQYNVLRILRGAGAEGLCRNEIRERLINRMPDATRLLDRMEDAGLISRTRSATDRRMVVTTLTPTGRQLVDELDEPVAQEHERRLGHMSEEQLRELSTLLTLFRQKLG